jgi:UDP-N-acetylmuramyl tripeptide synthase
MLARARIRFGGCVPLRGGGAVSRRVEIEALAARAVGRLSRAAGRGGGTTLPGKLLWKLDPHAIDELAAALPQGAALVSATNGKTTTNAMAARILGPGRRLAWNHSGANLASGVASTLLAARDADLALLEVDEFALPEVARRVRPRVVALGNLFRDQLDRYGELEHVAERWRAMVAGLAAATTLVVNADDPLVADLASGREGALRYGLDDPRRARPSLQHAADSKYCLRCGAPYVYAAAYVGHLGNYRCEACGHARPALDVAARSVELHGLEASSFELHAPAGAVTVRLPLPGLYNVYNALAAASLSLALGATLEDVRRGLEGFTAAFGRFEWIQTGGRRVLMLLIKNPAGANEAVRTLDEGGVPDVLVVALNDAIADGRDVSWIWDVDLEPLLASAERVVATGDRAAELALRLVYGGLPRERLEVIPNLERAFDRGLELVPEGGELAVLPTYTAMLRLRAIAAGRGLVRPYWERTPA